MKLSLLCILALIFVFPAYAEDKNGLRLLVTKKTLNHMDGKPGYMKEISRMMALKATLKNISMNKDLPEGKISSVVLIKRWAFEVGSLERYSKVVKVEPLRTAKESEVVVGEYSIGGHMHGTSDMHVDQVAAWKITVEHAGKTTEFLSNPAFEALNQRATDATR